MCALKFSTEIKKIDQDQDQNQNQNQINEIDNNTKKYEKYIDIVKILTSSVIDLHYY